MKYPLELQLGKGDLGPVQADFKRVLDRVHSGGVDQVLHPVVPGPQVQGVRVEDHVVDGAFHPGPIDVLARLGEGVGDGPLQPRLTVTGPYKKKFFPILLNYCV